MTPESPHTRFEVLLMKAVDGCLSADERLLLDRHLADCERCRLELSEFTTLKETTDMITRRILADADLEPVRPDPGSRAVIGFGMLLVLAGAALLLGFGMYQMVTDPEVPGIIKLGTGLMGLGALVLLAYLLRIRLRGRSHDPYKEIDR